MAGIPNSDYVPDPFPGISAAGTLAPGSEGDHASPGAVSITGSSGLPGIGIVMPLSSQADPGTDTATEPGQTATSVISPGPSTDYLSTGAGSGSGEHYPRRPGQQEASA